MNKRILGRTDIKATRLGYGAMELRGPRIWNGRILSDEQSCRILNEVLDAGINYIDTSSDYGLSEELIGRHISSRRSEYYLATKCGCTVVSKGGHDETPHVWTRENLVRNLEQSLERMNTEYIDLWQLHNPTVGQVRENGLIGVMEQMKADGKVRWFGISTTLPFIRTFVEWNFFDVFQIPYSALQRIHENAISEISRAGAGTVIRGAVARGLTAGSVRSDPDFEYKWQRAKLDELRRSGQSRTAFLLQFALSHQDIDTAIVGTADPEHLAENVRAAQAEPLPKDICEEAKRRLDNIGERSAETTDQSQIHVIP